MYWEIPQGSKINIQGLDCNIPPEGYVYNIATKKLEHIGVYSRSEIPTEQYWERIPLPNWYKETMKRWDKYDRSKKDSEEDFYDEQLEAFKKQEWSRRLNGFWFMNYNPKKGVSEAVYLTGANYLLLQWLMIDIGIPKFRFPDLEYYYFQQYCIEDNNCMGMIEITKRRFGKTYRGGVLLLDYVTRTKNTNGGIQSKTGGDAKKVFGKAVIPVFKSLPKFFKPEYDMSLGITPKTEIRFQQTNIRGKKAEEVMDKDELNSMIDFQSADKVAYDGQKLHRYFGDEFAKCFAKGTRIRMYNGSVKNVEDVMRGDLVMGDDSTPRLAMGITKGKEKMYEIIPNKGEGFSCNESHILTLSVSDKFKYNGVKYISGDILEITVRDYINNFPKRYYKSLALYRTGWELPEKKHLISPYMFGVWLGGGSSRDFSITSIDKEILHSINNFADEHGLKVRQKDDKISYHVTSNTVGKNHITAELRRLKVLKNKHIPLEYQCDSRENRLQLLAGLLDTDGYSICRNGFSSGMEITQKRKELAYNIHELALSLNFFASIKERISTMRREDGTIYSCPTYKVTIYGDIDLIPNKVDRKKALVSRTKNRRNPLKTGFSIKEIGIGEYFGFTVDRNNLFLLADGTVVHNTVETDVYERYDVIRYCLLDDEGNIIGKALYASTVEQLESEKEGVSEAAIQLWNDSDQMNKGENGRTPSGLYRFFMTSIRARNFDIYGYPDEVKTEQEIDADRATVKHNQRAWAARVRKEPKTIEEAFYAGNTTCEYNAENITNQIKWIEDNPEKCYWRQARLVEKKKKIPSVVIGKPAKESREIGFMDDEKGGWFILEEPSKPNAFSDRNGYLEPLNKIAYQIGVDTTQDRIAISGSNPAITVFKKSCIIDGVETGMYPVALWISPTRLDIHFDDEVRKASLWYGCECNYEIDRRTDFYRYFCKENCQTFLS